MVVYTSFNFSNLIQPQKINYTKSFKFIVPKLEEQNKLEQLNKDRSEFPLSDKLINQNYQTKTLKTFTDPFKFIKSSKTHHESQICLQLNHKDEISVSPQQFLDADLSIFLKHLNQISEFEYIIDLARQKFKPTIPESKQWFRFGGSSVWLPNYNCHYMVSRVLYTPSGIANKAFASFLYIQLFDTNWNELPNDTILEIPFEEEVSTNTVKLGFRKESFPQILPIPFDYEMHVENNKYYYGPEDPRIILRYHRDFKFHEPLIVFNMKDLQLVKRTMHIYFPYSKRLKIFKKKNEPYAKIEKNWTPFINNHQRNKLNFIYSIIPLEVLTCDLDSAICEFLQKPVKKDYNYVGPLRGGSQLLPIPKIANNLIKSLPSNRQIYIGWARAHLNKCGCGESMYRPNLIILIQDYNHKTNKYYYKLGYVSEYFDFDAKVPSWIIPKLDEDGQLMDTEPRQCEGRNVLIPNSIAYWDIKSIRKGKKLYDRANFKDIIESTNNEELEFHDYMGVTLSAADKDVSIVHINGLLNYILKLSDLFDEENVIESDNLFQLEGYELNNKCAMIASKEYCKSYALNHGVVFGKDNGN
ncbi:unnamed protein product [Candida verbasci]|uniref:Uncharacterized protein n=1 Tax=Candida verbasci TaxID=1227364 RepID=A0A9W4TZL0_9ASCO|nr:unnamed protein product [Candida verbasci]